MNAEQERVFERIDEILEYVDDAVEAVLSTAARRQHAGVANLVVWGRAVTNVLQNLRSVWPKFDEWYAPYQSQMMADTVMRRFYEMRSEVLKEGILAVKQATMLISVNNDLSLALGDPPAGATHAILHDPDTGKCGWLVTESSGDTRKVLHDIPPHVEVVNLIAFEPGLELAERGQVTEAAEDYQRFLRTMVADAKATIRPEGV